MEPIFRENGGKGVPEGLKGLPMPPARSLAEAVRVAYERRLGTVEAPYNRRYLISG